MTNKETGRKNNPQLFLPLFLNSSIPITAIKVPSNKDDIGLYEKSLVIKPYPEIATTAKARLILIIFNAFLPQID